MFDGNGCCAHFCWSGQSSATQSESDMCLNEAPAGRDHKSCLRDEKQTSMTCSRMENCLAGYLFRWLSPSCIWLQHPGLAPAAHLLAQLWWLVTRQPSSSSKRTCVLKLLAVVHGQRDSRREKQWLRWALVHHGLWPTSTGAGQSVETVISYL